MSEAQAMAYGRKNIPGMIGATAAMGFIVGQYVVATILFVAPHSGIGRGGLVALALPVLAAAIGALVGTTLTRSAATERSDWRQASPA
jgi:hypothetical protein